MIYRNMLNEKYRALLGLAGTVILFSLLVVIAKGMTVNVPSMYIFFLRMFFASIVFLPFFIIGRVWKKNRFKQLILISLLSSGNVAGFMWGIEFTTASASQIIYAAMPILTILITVAFLQEKYSMTTIVGVLIGLIGIIFIIYQSAVEKGLTISGGLTGNLVMVLAMSCWLAYVLLSKKMSRIFSPTEIGSTSVLITFSVSIILFLIQYISGDNTISLNRDIIVSTFFMGVFGTFLTYLLLQYAIKILRPLTVNLTSYIQPIVTAFLAYIFLGEKLTLSFAVGSVLVFSGVFLTATLEFYQRRK